MADTQKAESFQASYKFPLLASLLSIVLGLIYLYTIRDVPQFKIPVIDEWSYDDKAQGILMGTWPSGKVFYQDPLYPYFLAFIYWLIGRDVVAVKVIHVFLGGLHVFLVFEICKMLFGFRTARVGALLSALYKPMFFFEGILTKEILSLVLTDLSILCLVWAKGKSRRDTLGHRGWRFLLAGALLGLSAMTRANLLAFVPFVALWLVLGEKDAGADAAGQMSRRVGRGLLNALFYCAGLGIAISPVTIHNIRAGDFVLLTSQGGQNFYIGNHPGNQSGTYLNPPFVRAHPRFEEEDFKRAAQPQGLVELKPSQISKHWYRMSFEYMREEPRAFWRHMLFKTALFFNNYEESDNVNYYFYKENFSPLLKLPLPGFGVLVVLGCAGWLMLLFRRGKGGGAVEDGGVVLLIFLPVFALSTIAYYIFDRYRIPALSAMLPLSAFTLKVLWEYLQEGRLKKLMGFVYLLGVLSVVAYYPIKKPRFDAAHFQLANGLRQMGRYIEAINEYKKAVALAPTNPAIWLNLGVTLYQVERYEESADVLEEAVRFFPTNPELLESLGNTYVKLNRLGDAIVQYELAINNGGSSARLYQNTSDAYRALGMNKMAELYQRKALEARIMGSE